MKLISCHDGKLHTLDVAEERGGSNAPAGDGFRTGLAALDVLPPGAAFARGAVHELLAKPNHPKPMLLPAWLAQCARDDKKTGVVVWSDPHNELYPPALASLGIPLERLFLIHPTSDADELWALAECLRCPGVAAVVAAVPERRRGLSRVEARRLQLAAERGGGVGIFTRTAGKRSSEHAAVTRWLVAPQPGERLVQRWRIQLIFGHGGRVGETVILEHHRDRATAAAQPLHARFEARPLRPAAELGDRPPVQTPGRVTA
jgi:protein ImuA